MTLPSGTRDALLLAMTASLKYERPYPPLWLGEEPIPGQQTSMICEINFWAVDGQGRDYYLVKGFGESMAAVRRVAKREGDAYLYMEASEGAVWSTATAEDPESLDYNRAVVGFKVPLLELASRRDEVMRQVDVIAEKAIREAWAPCPLGAAYADQLGRYFKWGRGA